MAGVEGPGNPLLTLGLGRSPSSSETNSKVSSPTACMMSPSSVKEADEESSMDLGLSFDLCLGHDTAHRHKKPSAGAPKLDLQLSLSTCSPESALTNVSANDGLETVADTTTTLEKLEPWIFRNYMASSSSYAYASEATYGLSLPKIPEDVVVVPSTTDVSSAVTVSVKSPAPKRSNISTKCCQFPGCEKGARGASGYCIAHGGGRRCQKPGCQKGAEGRTIYCKAHGGGRRCQYLGCTKSAEGRTDHCIAHGGGRRCSQDGCSRAARGRSGLCIKHGGGKRCQRESCRRSAEGHSGLCISHGGGRRCQFPECAKGAQGSTGLCKAHGGGKRCTFPGCTRGAEGSTWLCKAHGGGKRCAHQGGGSDGACPKSVHGGTRYCVAHGGGKRCMVAGCTRSARGRTEHCVRHGGGRRCRAEGCAKSAQGSTDFCKAHGGGKRCVWGQEGSSLGAGGPPCDRFARSRVGLCAGHGALVEDRCVHGGGSLGPAPAIGQLTTDCEPAAAAAATRGDADMADGDEEAFLTLGWNGDGESAGGTAPAPAPAPFMEGRVHGSGLLALLSCSGNGGASAASSSGMRTWM